MFFAEHLIECLNSILTPSPTPSTTTSRLSDRPRSGGSSSSRRRLLTLLIHPPILHHGPDLQLLAPRAPGPLERPVPPAHAVVELADPLLGKDAAAQDHGRDLDKHLELDCQAAVHRVSRVEQQVRQERDAAEPQRAAREALPRDRREGFWRGDVFDRRWWWHFFLERESG